MILIKSTILIILVVIGFSTLGMLGIVASYFISDTTPPYLQSLKFQPTAYVNETIDIHAYLNDKSTIQSCKLYYRTNTSTWTDQEMKLYSLLCCPPRYIGRIGPFYSPTTIEFYIIAVDSSNNQLITDINVLTIL